MSRKPLDKGRVAFVAEKYPTGPNQMKNRYATAGRATKWPADNGGENIEIELDSVPLGATGPVKFFIFWDSQESGQSDQPPVYDQPVQGQPMNTPTGYFYSNGAPMEPQTAQRFQAAGIQPWPKGQPQPTLPAGY